MAGSELLCVLCALTTQTFPTLSLISFERPHGGSCEHLCRSSCVVGLMSLSSDAQMMST